MNKKDFLKEADNGVSGKTILKNKSANTVGRPTKSDDQKASESLLIKLTKNEKQALIDGADGMPLSSWVKGQLRKAGLFMTK